MPILINWKGLIFYDCKILSPVDELKISGNYKWNIKCNCGKIFKTMPISLKTGATKSCGCLKIKQLIKRTHENKIIYTDYKNEITNIKILRPVKLDEDKRFHDWICVCPHHEIPKEFIGTPGSVINGHTTSCGCLTVCNFSKYHKRIRVEKGLNENQYLLNENELIRKMLFEPIRYLIFKIDNYKCKLCNVVSLNRNAHHINPVSNIIFNNRKSLYNAYDLKNLITLCEECHEITHGFSWKELDKTIQQKLQTITNSRIIPQDLFDEYNEIVKTKIEPWLDNYLKNKEDNEKH
jgi:hypothetical protein